MKSVDRGRGFRFHETSPTLYLELFAVFMVVAAVARLALAYHAASSSLAANDFSPGSFTTTGSVTPLSRGIGGSDTTFDKTSTWENADTVYFPVLPTLPHI
jgi:hypothetical protein